MKEENSKPMTVQANIYIYLLLMPLEAGINIFEGTLAG